ncbi:MAG: ABC transporter permease [Muribaculaceae bacterium]|nr:ABC transporter permease [Muribaculaceae bacterium]
MKFSYWISRRISLRHGATAGSATGAVIAVAGVALALMVMELSIAVSVGFKHEIRRKLAGFEAPVSVLPGYNYDTRMLDAEMTVEPELLNVIEEAAPGCNVVKSVTRRAILKTEDNFVTVECLSHDANHDDTFERGNVTSGHWPDMNASGDSVVISEKIAALMDIGVGERTFLYFFVDGRVRVRRAVIAGLYDSSFGEFDSSVIYAPFKTLQSLGDSAGVTSLDIENVTIDDAPIISARINEALTKAAANGTLSNVYPVTDITERGQMYLTWLDLLDTNVVVILALLLCVAAFTLISSLFILILDHVSTIGLLRALGASSGVVSRIFVNMAMRLVGLGLLIGNILGLGVAIAQYYTHFIPLDPEMYYLSYVPVEFPWLLQLYLNIGVIIGAWLILILPARLAARIDPASTMRYE